jgi:DNA-binding HxlR family transcriptional regulator
MPAHFPIDDRSSTQPRVTYGDYLDGCPAVQLLSSVGNRWTSLALSALGQHQGPLRYSAISRTVPGVTQKMLTQTLRTLERDGLVTRSVTPSVPVRVDYELTNLGRSLHQILDTLGDWATVNIDLMEAARARYDAAQDGVSVPAPR